MKLVEFGFTGKKKLKPNAMVETAKAYIKVFDGIDTHYWRSERIIRYMMKKGFEWDDTRHAWRDYRDVLREDMERLAVQK